MAAPTKPRRRTTKPAGESNGARLLVLPEFAPGSLEAELSAIGQSAPARELARVPADYFANLDRYRFGSSKKK
jgi:hypothetical protein